MNIQIPRNKRWQISEHGLLIVPFHISILITILLLFLIILINITIITYTFTITLPNLWGPALIMFMAICLDFMS